MTGPGDAQSIPCPRCGDELPLTALLDHLEAHAAHGEVTR